MLLGCSRHNKTDNNVVFVQNNDFLLYMNYTESEEYGFPFFHDPTVTDFSLDAKKQENKIPITGNDSLLVRKILENFKYLYYKDFDENYYKEFVIDTITPEDYFFCGKISVADEIYFVNNNILETDSVNSFLILTEQPEIDIFNIGTKSVFRELYLFNFKNNKLTSIVQLSRFAGDIDNINYGRSHVVTYFMRYNFSQINHNATGPPQTAEEASLPVHEISDFAKLEKDAKFIFLHLSRFRINKNGFVELNW